MKFIAFKKLLMVCDIGFPPQFKAWRNIKLAKYLSLYGWKPVILSVKYPNDNQFNKMKGGLADDLINSKINRTRIFQPRLWKMSPHLPISRKLLLQIPDNRVGWIPFAVHSGKKIIRKEKIDAIFSSSGPNTAHLIAYVLHKKTKLPWVAEFSDHWTTLHAKSRNPIQKLEEKMEHTVLKNASRILVACDGIKEGLLRKHDISEEKISVNTLGHDSEDFIDINPKRFSSKFTILFFGNLVLPQDIFPFIKAMEIIDQNIRNEIQLFITGKIDRQEMKIIKQAKMKSIKIYDVKIYDFVPHHKALEYLMGADILLLVLRDFKDTYGNSLFKNMHPAKLFEYIKSEKPILAIVPPDGASAKLVKKTKTGVVVDPTDIESIKDAILNFYKRWKVGGLLIHPDWDEIGKYDWKYLTKGLVDILDELYSHE